MTPLDKLKLKETAQSRSMLLGAAQGETEKRLDSANYVEGLAARYEPYVLYDGGEEGVVYERFAPGCFDTTDMTDVILQYDHAGRVFARTSNGSLIVEPNEDGLFVAADLSRTELARGLYEDINAGMITKMSWRFRVGDYTVERTAGSKDVTIVHTAVPKIFDVSAVSIPANDTTAIGARSFAHGVMDELARSEAEVNERRTKLKIKIMKELNT